MQLNFTEGEKVFGCIDYDKALQQSEEVDIFLCPFIESVKERLSATNVHKL